ncbi:hypothetical protein IKQ21_05245 [bacterium]|nr:hypothetical protein [bacterium]
MNKKQLIFLLIFITLMTCAHIDYTKNNYDVTGFVFICNEDICEIRHTKSNGQIKYTEKINIAEIENFSSEMENIPRTKSQGMVIYANRKDGTRFRLSPIYVSPSRYLESELLAPLNAQIQQKPVSINVKFPY